MVVFIILLFTDHYPTASYTRTHLFPQDSLPGDISLAMNWMPNLPMVEIPVTNKYNDEPVTPRQPPRRGRPDMCVDHVSRARASRPLAYVRLETYIEQGAVARREKGGLGIRMSVRILA